MNHYLDVLGLKPGADKKAIKQAYRKLSKRFHPDVNQHPEAHARFIAINEAYKFLMMAGPSPYASQNTTAYDYDPHQKAYEEWRRQAREYAHAKARKVDAERRKTILTALTYFNYLAVCIFTLSTVLIIDYFLPSSAVEEELMQIAIQRIHYDRYNDEQVALDMAEKIISTEYHAITVRGPLDPTIQFYDKAMVYHSPIFRKTTGISLTIKQKTQYYEALGQIYNIFGFFIWVNFILSLAYKFAPVNPSTKLNFAIVMSMFFIIEIYVAFVRI